MLILKSWFIKWQWDYYYGSCWLFNADESQYSIKSGKINGLHLKLYIAGIDDFYTFSSSAGAHVYINNASYDPSFVEGYDVAVNSETNMAVSREIATFLPKPHGSCVQDIGSFGTIFTDMFAKNKIYYNQTRCFE